MADTTIAYGSDLILPAAVRDRYQIEPNSPVRLIETRSGILLIPLTQAPMDAELASELAEWQALGADTLQSCAYAFPRNASTLEASSRL